METVMDKNFQSAVVSGDELVLLGIEKVWVKTKNGWVDKAKLVRPAKKVTNDLAEDNSTLDHSPKWWQFWK